MVNLSEKQKNQLGWLPQVGEWYRVTPDSSIWAFEKVTDLLKFYSEPPQFGRRGKREQSPDMLNVSEHTALFVTRVTLPDLDNMPAIIDFMTLEENGGWSKAMFMPMIPPNSTLGASVWQMLLEHTTAEVSDVEGT